MEIVSYGEFCGTITCPIELQTRCPPMCRYCQMDFLPTDRVVRAGNTCHHLFHACCMEDWKVALHASKRELVCPHCAQSLLHEEIRMVS